MTPTKPFQLGSISTGTLRPHDLLPVYAAMLNQLTIAKEQPSLVNEATDATQYLWDYDDEYAHEQAANILEDIDTALNELCPPFVYFGARCRHEHTCGCGTGGGVDFGFWPDWDALAACCYDDASYRNGNEYTLAEYIVQWRHPDKVTVMDHDRHILWSTV